MAFAQLPARNVVASFSCSTPPLRLVLACTTPQQPSLSTCSSSPPFKARSSAITRLPTAADLSTITMPSLHSSFPALVHAHYASVKEPCDAWIQALAAPPSVATSRFLHDCLFPLFVCRFVPHAISQQRLVHTIKTIAWLMIADDDDDHPDALGSDVTTTALCADLVMAILRSTGDGRVAATESSFFAACARPHLVSKSTRKLKFLAELWDEIRTEMSPSLQSRFMSTMADYFEGLKMQATFREDVRIPDVESYMEIRRQASFTIPIFVLMEYALGIELEETTFHNPLIQELRIVALDYISLCNDIFSCRIEIGMGDYFNLPFILYNCEVPSWSYLSFQNTIDHVAQMVEDLNTHAISLISTIHEECKDIDSYKVASIHAYVHGLSLTMSGALAWFHETARYKHAHARIELLRVGMKEMYT